VAACLRPEEDRVKVLLFDGLSPRSQPEVWPDCYFHGHEWPPELESNSPPYAAELYTRGIDSYVWAEGYVIRGPNAGWFTTADIPYWSYHRGQKHFKVFDGPYPQ
jgi:hypothetical protein